MMSKQRSITQEDIDCDRETKAKLEFISRISRIMKRPKIAKDEPIETKSRFIEAKVALITNPFHEEPFGEVQSMEDLIKIKNPHQISHQLKK